MKNWPSTLEPPTLSAYDRERRRKRIYLFVCLMLAAALAAVGYIKVRDNYRAGGKPWPAESKP